MKVFISWSGEQSRQIAEALRSWLPMVIQAVKPYMSERDNEAGSRWNEVVSAELEASDFGIICLTKSNLASPWIHFEAGALGKVVDKAHVVPLLYNLKPADVAPPLSQFMMKSLDAAGIRDVLEAVNNNLDTDRRLTTETLATTFEAMWPRLGAALESVAERAISESEPPPSSTPIRSDRQLLEEILGLLRQPNPQRMPGRATTAVFKDLLDELRNIVGSTGFVRYNGTEYAIGRSDGSSLTREEREELYLLMGRAKGLGVDIKVDSTLIAD